MTHMIKQYRKARPWLQLCNTVCLMLTAGLAGFFIGGTAAQSPARPAPPAVANSSSEKMNELVDSREDRASDPDQAVTDEMVFRNMMMGP